MASFRAGNFDFVLLSAHVRWGDDAAGRVGELTDLANWVDRRRRHRDVADKDIIVMGDFNIPDVKGPLLKAVSSKGLRIPKTLLDVSNDQACSNLARNKRYDQILHYPGETTTFTDNAGVLDFYKGNFRKLFPGTNATKSAYTYQLSDHLPLWVQLDTWTDDEDLDQLIGSKRKRARENS